MTVAPAAKGESQMIQRRTQGSSTSAVPLQGIAERTDQSPMPLQQRGRSDLHKRHWIMGEFQGSCLGVFMQLGRRLALVLVEQYKAGNREIVRGVRILTKDADCDVQHACVGNDLGAGNEALGNIQPDWLHRSHLIHKTSEDGRAEQQHQSLHRNCVINSRLRQNQMRLRLPM